MGPNCDRHCQIGYHLAGHICMPDIKCSNSSCNFHGRYVSFVKSTHVCNKKQKTKNKKQKAKSKKQKAKSKKQKAKSKKQKAKSKKQKAKSKKQKPKSKKQKTKSKKQKEKRKNKKKLILFVVAWMNSDTLRARVKRVSKAPSVLPAYLAMGTFFLCDFYVLLLHPGTGLNTKQQGERNKAKSLFIIGSILTARLLLRPKTALRHYSL
jgi:cation transport ATPase